MIFNLMLSIFYIATTITTLYSLIKIKNQYIYVAFYVFVGFLFLSLGPVISLVSNYYGFYNIKVSAFISFSKIISIIFLLKTVINIRVQITESKIIYRKKIFNFLLVLYIAFSLFLPLFRLMEPGLISTVYPVIYSDRKLNLIIAFIDSITMLLVMIHLPNFKEYIFIKIGSSMYAFAAWSLYVSSISPIDGWLIITWIFLILNPVINTISILTLYYHKSQLTKMLLIS